MLQLTVLYNHYGTSKFIKEGNIKKLFILIVLSNVLHGFSVTLSPGWSYAAIPEGLVPYSKSVGNPILNLQTGFDISPIFGIYIKGTYNPQRFFCDVYNDDGEFLGVYNLNLTNLFLSYEHRFTIPLRDVSPYFTLGAAIRFGFWDFGDLSSENKFALNLIVGHGYKIHVNPHFAFMPEINLFYQLTSPSRFYGLMASFGLNYDL